AGLSCDTDYDFSNVTISCLSEYFAKAAEIAADVVANPAFDEKEIASEKKNIIAGQISRKDSIWLTSMDNFTRLYYIDAPYAWPVDGKQETVNNIKRDTIIEWHKFTYNASNILIVVSGNLDTKTVKDSLEKYFGSIGQGKKFDKPVFSAVMPDKVENIKGKFNQAFIVKGFAAPALKEKDFVTLKVIGNILGGRMTSRLFVELREKLGLAYEVSTVFPSRINQSFFAIYIGLDKKNIALTQKRIDEILKDFRSKEIDEQELKDTKSYIKGLYIMDRQTVMKRSYYFGWREVTGQGYEYDKKYLEEIDAVTPKDIYETANRIFGSPSLTAVLSNDRVKSGE
ncbi:MAG: insulinase family protein, partial [Endomicrobia bacterium]|nr:insulinase family protein [Endomicrobiia bacterium]